MNVDLVPGRWWRVLDAEGGLWMETSNEAEAREAVEPGFTLQNLWVPPRDTGEWRTET
jgi:hypothetical protein